MEILDAKRIVLTPERMANRVQRPWPQTERTKNVYHVQAINKVLGVAAGKLTSDESDAFPFDKFTDTFYPMQPALGVAWEEFFASFYAEDELIWQPGEMSRDGIYGNPDGILLREEALWECKQTTKKICSIQDMWMYLKQGMAYCAISGFRRVRYDVCFLLGDYKRPYTAEGISSLVQFSESEIESWWSVMLNNKDKARVE